MKRVLRQPHILGLLLSFLAVACDTGSTTDPGAAPPPPPSLDSVGPTPEPPAALSAEPEPSAEPAPAEPEERPPWPGPFFHVTRSSTGVYSEMTFERSKKIGYAQQGTQVAVHEDVVKTSNCSSGWYRAVDGGFLCGDHGTTNEKDERVRNRRKQPKLDAVLPYTYARNAHNGTPLYRSVPSREQMYSYEPYLEGAKKDSPSGAERQPAPKPAERETQPATAEMDERTRKAKEDQERRMQALREARRAMLGEAAARKLEEQERIERQETATAPVAAESDAGADKPWWQRDDAELHKIKLEDLDVKGDDVIAKRMVKGFYIAVDSQFRWNDRHWYRSTTGHVAPADRFHVTQGSEFKGVELDDTWRLPIAWVYGWKNSKPRYRIVDGKTPKPDGTYERFSAINLTGKEIEVGKRTYLEDAEGYWVRARDVRVTRPGPPPADVQPQERWVDVNLATQTVVLFRGTEPVYATLISSGKEHRDKEKDHKTPVGEFRVREKHVTATMDGDGTAAGDLPYSIESVPYVMYFEGSYALHGAFWHRNYGIRMSHGCVNLAPLDAKYIFFNSDPPVAPGWHGAWAADDRPGSRVIVHE